MNLAGSSVLFFSTITIVRTPDPDFHYFVQKLVMNNFPRRRSGPVADHDNTAKHDGLSLPFLTELPLPPTPTD